ncbi:hypothetical protein GCM10009131_04040 [Morganella psychrotolerans]
MALLNSLMTNFIVETIKFSHSGKGYFMTMLYKYTNCDLGLRIIDNQSFHWSAVSSFNDPFECLYLTENNIKTRARTIAVCLSINHPILQTEKIAHLIKNYSHIPEIIALSELRNLIKECHSEYTNNKTKDCYFNIERKIYNLIIDKKNKILESKSVFHKSFYSNASKVVFDKRGILCLSKSKNNILMWSHYSHNHSGVMFELNKDNFNLNKSVSMHDIMYQSDTPVCSYNELLSINTSLSSDENLFKKSILTKSSSWSYEEEVRLIRAITNENRLFSFPKESFNAIYLGCKIKDEEREEIISKVKEKLPNTLLFQTEINGDNYNLDYYTVQ